MIDVPSFSSSIDSQLSISCKAEEEDDLRKEQLEERGRGRKNKIK
jgi:hypothetical protein